MYYVVIVVVVDVATDADVDGLSCIKWKWIDQGKNNTWSAIGLDDEMQNPLYHLSISGIMSLVNSKIVLQIMSKQSRIMFVKLISNSPPFCIDNKLSKIKTWCGKNKLAFIYYDRDDLWSWGIVMYVKFSPSVLFDASSVHHRCFTISLMHQ